MTTKPLVRPTLQRNGVLLCSQRDNAPLSPRIRTLHLHHQNQIHSEFVGKRAGGEGNKSQQKILFPIRHDSIPRMLFLILGSVLSLSLSTGCAKKEGTSASLPMPIAKSNTESQSSSSLPTSKTKIRFATFNVALNRKKLGALADELANGDSPATAQIAEIIQRVNPDVLLINEFDYDEAGDGLKAFQSKFLQRPHHDVAAIEFPHVYFGPVNTGVDSGLDLNGDGKTGTPEDAYGYGEFPGQYGMVVLSKYPIDTANIRTFQMFLWTDMPNANWPIDPKTKKLFYSDEVKVIFRLSSKSHWDVPIQIGDETIHFLVSHPTPPVFDGAEDRNGCRNHDEIRFWTDYISGSDYMTDDAGRKGGLAQNAKFVVAGDQNADPVDGDSKQSAAKQLTEHGLINHSTTPQSTGGVYYAKEQGGANEKQTGDPAFDTGDFNDFNVGNMRIDYCLPSKNLKLMEAGVFWPAPAEPGADLPAASDHRLVWIDVEVQ